jgi:hypothetical protein
MGSNDNCLEYDVKNFMFIKQLFIILFVITAYGEVLEKLTVAQLVNKFPAFYGIRSLLPC